MARYTRYGNAQSGPITEPPWNGAGQQIFAPSASLVTRDERALSSSLFSTEALKSPEEKLVLALIIRLVREVRSRDKTLRLRIFNTSLFDHSFQILPPSPGGFIIINTALLLFKDVRHQMFEVGVQQKRRIKLPNTAFESTKTSKVKLKKNHDPKNRTEKFCLGKQA